MDFHILIVIACVFLASLFSLIFINKIFRRKTFEEVIAEKKALSANLYAQSKAASGASKKPKKKELKREKKQRQKEQQRDVVVNTEQEDSDAQSEQPSVEDESAPLTPPPGLSKTHVEFEPEPEVLTYAPGAEDKRRASNGEKENLNVGNKLKNRKAGKNGNGAKPTAGILINKNEPVAVKPQTSNVVEELNNFDIKPPKDVLELKKQEKQEREKKDDKKKEDNNKKEKNVKKEKLNALEKITATPVIVAAAVEQAVEVPHIAKELLRQQQQDEKVRQGSPKTQHNVTNNKTKQQQKKQQQHQKDAQPSTTKELVLALDKLSENETVGVSLFMKLFRRAELNRSEIQILIDYLLNKQQDMPASHSEWSDDICQKLKRQLEEKEKALAEEQEASIGIQAKLRELRTEINTERAQMNANIKAYIDKLHGKEQELSAVNQELQQVNDKFALERQQFQAKLLREKQAGSQDLLAQLTLMQNELAQREKVIAELTPFVNASRQAVEESQQRNEIIQQQAQQMRTLEQQRDELEALQNNSIFELEKLKTLEAENAEIKVEIRNLQNALESAKVDLSQSLKELDAYKNELAHVRQNELGEKQKEIAALQAKNAELLKELAGISSKAIEQTKEQTGLQVTVDALQQQLAIKEQQLSNADAKQFELQTQARQQLETTERQSAQQQQELQKLVDALKADVAGKQTQLQAAQQAKELAVSKEKELLQQLSEQREKNNDIRMKNWKLVEALQNAEITTQKLNMQNKQTLANANVVQQEKLLAVGAQHNTRNGGAPASAKDEQHLRALFQRLYPEAVKACAGTALSVSFDQWVEQVLEALVRQTEQQSSKATAVSSSNKSTQSNSNSNNNNNSNSSSNNYQQQKTHHNSNNSSSNNINSNNITSTSGNSNSSDNGGAPTTEEQQDLYTQNLKLRSRIDGLTQIVTKTSNTLQELESHAREQEEHWRAIVRQKDDTIHRLQHLNGEQNL